MRPKAPAKPEQDSELQLPSLKAGGQRMEPCPWLSSWDVVRGGVGGAASWGEAGQRAALQVQLEQTAG